MERRRKTQPRASAPADEVELLEDRTQHIHGRRAARRLSASIPAALAGAFLITTLALGASFRGDQIPGAGSGDGTTAGETTADAPDATTPGVDATDGAGEPDGPPDGNPDADGTPDTNPKPDATPEANPEPDGTPDGNGGPDTTPQPRPDAESISLVLRLDGGKVVVDWGRCEPDGFLAWKVVRSTDASVDYPKGANDTLVAVVEANATTSFVDGGAIAGRTVWYRVFGIAQGDGEAWVACRSAAREIHTPAPTPATETLGLTVSLRDGAPFVDWTACHAAGFDAYKVVRSTDSTVRWPLGDNDRLVAVVGPDGSTAIRDGDAPSGRKLWYRVFCVDSIGDGYVVRGSSAAKAIVTPTDKPVPTPVPEPAVLGFEAGQVADGIALDWQACNANGFAYYKVVRSQTNPYPTYPLNDGAQLVAVIENAGVSNLVDHDVAAGQTWHYRVLCFGYSGDTKVLRGITPVRTVTAE